MIIDELENLLQGATRCCPINRGWYNELDDGSIVHFQIPIDEDFPKEFHYELAKTNTPLVIHNESGALFELANLIQEKTKDNPDVEIKNGCVICLKESTNSKDLIDITNKFKKLYNIVNPIVLEYKENLLSVIAIVNSFAEVYQKEKSKLPFSFNVIDELHINENAHSRVLAKLLQFKVEKKYPILESFLKLLRSRCQSEMNINIESPDISNERNRIDALIVEKGKYAIIIENKIYWAGDQKDQIDRYVDCVRQSGFKKNETTGLLDNVFVVYLTQDGRKEVSSESFNKAREVLGWKSDSEQGQFIPLNYKDDILPWLKNDVLPNCALKEDLLSSGIKQYIDYLDGLLGLRKNQIDLMYSMKGLLLKKCSINENDSISEKILATERMIQETNDLKSVLSTYKDELVSFVISFCDTTEKILRERYPNENWQKPLNYISWEDGYLQIRSGNWDSLVHLEWYPLSQRQLVEETEYRLVLHVEGICQNTIGDILQNQLNVGKKSSEGELAYFIKTFSSEKPFAILSEKERESFLKSVYEDDEVATIIDKVNEAYKLQRS